MQNQSSVLNVILVGNYVTDRQESMQRYAELLQSGLRAQGISATIVRPQPFLGRLRPGIHGLGKWLGYCDKFLFFPLQLRRLVRQAGAGTVVHICDHSNSMYVHAVRDWPHLVTCHDVLAIRSAYGDFPQNPTSWTGKKFQALILRGLRAARLVACVSEETRDQLKTLGGFDRVELAVVPNGLNYAYRPMDEHEQVATLQSVMPALAGKPASYIFHIGGNQWYKNREGVLRIYFEYVRAGGRLPLVMAGKPFTGPMNALIANKPLQAEVVQLGNVSNLELNALYARSACLFFPSAYEGFGWPIVEAMASGAIVVTTGRPPMSEIGGEAASYLDEKNEPMAGLALLNLLSRSESVKAAQRLRGFAQAEIFSADRMIDSFIALYQRALLSYGKN